jgi:hypothetical protein
MDDRPLELLGLSFEGKLNPADVAVAAVLVVEVIDADTSDPTLRVLSTRMPVWHRLGMLSAVVASDQVDLIGAFERDD